MAAEDDGDGVQRLDIEEVPDDSYIVEVRAVEEVLVQAEDLKEAKERALEKSDIPNGTTGRAARSLAPWDERRSERYD